MNQISLFTKLIALLASISSSIFIYKQKLSYFSQIRIFMATACLSFSSMIMFSFLPQNLPSFAQTFERVSVTLALFSAILTGLSSASTVDYPEKRKLKELLNAALERKDKLFLFFLTFESFGVFITWIPAFIPQIQQLHTQITQENLVLVSYEEWFSLYLLFCIVLVWIYPVSKFLIFSKRTKDKRVKRASLIFGISIFTISSSSLIFNVVLDVLFKLCIPFVSPLVTAASYLAIAYSFRETTVLIGAFEIFSQKIGLKHKRLKGEKILLEFDPSSNYYLTVRDFILESLAYGEEVHLFTTPKSTLHRIFRGHEKVKLYLLSTKPTSTTHPHHTNEIEVPLENPSVLLGKIWEITESAKPNKCIVFDNLSVLTLHTDPAKSYKFITYLTEETSRKNITTLILFNPKAHDEKFSSAIRTLFEIQLFYDTQGLKKIKIPPT